MDNELNNINDTLLLEDERIVNYLKGRMTAEEEHAFIEELKTNPEFKSKAVAMARMVKGLKEVGKQIDEETTNSILASNQSEIEDNLTANADEASVIQLLSILTDNALKYALPETVVMLRLMKQGKHICFETVNAWDQATPPDQLDRFFDRFYRADKSRSGGSKTKGYGLGLSIAHAIAEKNHLSLTVSEDAEHRIVFRVLFP